MAFKKQIYSDAPIVMGDSSVKKLFPPGFRYRLGSIIYTVKLDCTQEAASPMRRVLLSDGATEIIPVETMLKDLKDPECDIMDPDLRYAVATEAAVKEEPKKTKKKSKKKTKKATKKKVTKRKKAPKKAS